MFFRDDWGEELSVEKRGDKFSFIITEGHSVVLDSDQIRDLTAFIAPMDSHERQSILDEGYENGLSEARREMRAYIEQLQETHLGRLISALEDVRGFLQNGH